MKMHFVAAVALAALVSTADAAHAQRLRGSLRSGIGQVIGGLRGRIADRRDVVRDREQELAEAAREREQASFQEGYQAAVRRQQQLDAQRALAARRDDLLRTEGGVRAADWQAESYAAARPGFEGLAASSRPPRYASPSYQLPLRPDRFDYAPAPDDDAVTRYPRRDVPPSGSGRELAEESYEDIEPLYPPLLRSYAEQRPPVPTLPLPYPDGIEPGDDARDTADYGDRPTSLSF